MLGEMIPNSTHIFQVVTKKTPKLLVNKSKFKMVSPPITADLVFENANDLLHELKAQARF